MNLNNNMKLSEIFEWWAIKDSKEKGRLVAIGVATLMVVSWGFSELRELSSKPAAGRKKVATQRSTVESPRPKNKIDSRRQSVPLPPPKPSRMAPRPLIKPDPGLIPKSAPRASEQPEVSSKPEPLEELPLASLLDVGTVFRGTAGSTELAYVELVVHQHNPILRQLLVTVRLRDYPLWCIYRGTYTPQGKLVLKSERASGRRPIRPPAAELVEMHGINKLELYFEDSEKLVGTRGQVKSNLNRDAEATKMARKNLIKAPIAALAYKKFHGLTTYEIDAVAAGFYINQDRANLPIELWIGEVAEDLKQVKAILSVRDGDPSWKIYLVGTVLADGVSISFRQQNIGARQFEGNVGDLLAQRNPNLEVMLTPEGDLVGHRANYFLNLSPIPGIYKPKPRTSGRRSR